MSLDRRKITIANLDRLLNEAKAQLDTLAFKEITAPVRGAVPAGDTSVSLSFARVESSTVGRPVSREEREQYRASILAAAQRLRDRYELESVIGAGGQGVVIKGRRKGAAEAIVLKLRLLRDDEPELNALFETEMAMMVRIAQLIPPHDSLHGYIQIFAHGVLGKLQWAEMEFFPGANMDQVILNRRDYLLADRLIHILRIAIMLGVLHANRIVHADIKPQNILVSPDKKALRLCDYGASRVLGEETAIMLGTPYYMPPEQMKHQALDARSDIYSLGMVLYELIEGHTPYHEIEVQTMHDLARLREAIIDTEVQPKRIQGNASNHAFDQMMNELNRIVMRMIAKDPADRYPSMRQFITDYGSFVTLAIDRYELESEVLA